MKLKLFIWGTGKIADEILGECQTLSAYEILGFIDNNKNKEGKFFYNKEIFLPKILENVLPDKIVILTDAYDAILQQIIREFPQLQNVVEDKHFFYKQSILKRYRNSKDREIVDVLKNINKEGLHIFNYDFRKKYVELQVDVFWDEEYELFYVVHFEKRMYFSKKYNTKQAVTEYYRFVLMEQDMDSPHRYLSKGFDVEEGDIVVDAGVAEGNFSLEVIDRVKKIYLIETDDDWIDALKITFKDYKDKVVIIKAFLSSYDESDIARMDTLINEPIDFIKLDIEGSEWDALCGAKTIIENSTKLKIAACAYHSDYDLELLEYFMDKNNLIHETTSGYMWYPFKVKQNHVSTRLCRAIVRGTLVRKI